MSVQKIRKVQVIANLSSIIKVLEIRLGVACQSVLGGVMGLSVGDALGVPVEFSTRAELSENPVVGMGSFGTYSLPAGTWSDDTSMTMCLAESLCKGLDYKDIMDNFLKWITTGAFTPFGKVFGVGNGTRRALEKYARGVPPLNVVERQKQTILTVR